MLRAILASVSVGALGAVLSQFCACSTYLGLRASAPRRDRLAYSIVGWSIVVRPMPVPNVVAVGGFTDRILRCESPVLQRINELAFKAAHNLIILVSPERDRKPRPIFHKSALVETTLRVRLVHGLLPASQRHPPKLVVLRVLHHSIPHQ